MSDSSRKTEICGKATILSESDPDDHKWILTFNLNGKVRFCIRYERDFHTVWPSEIKDIKHIITIGSCNWDDLVSVYDRVEHEDIASTPNAEPDPHRSGIYHVANPHKTDTFRNMVSSRTTLPFTWLSLSYSHPNFPEHSFLFNGRGEEVLIRRTTSGPSERIDKETLIVWKGDITIRYGVTQIAQVTIESVEGDWYTQYSETAPRNVLHRLISFFWSLFWCLRIILAKIINGDPI